MRAIAEQAFAFVREYKGSHSGEHGDGIVRSEFHEFMFGKRLVRAFEEVKDRFDPDGLYNPGKIVRAPKFDDRTNFRYGPDYHAQAMTTRLDWSAYPGAGGGFQGAVEMCNNNGACRAAAGGVMCPSYRVTREERDVTRGRANSLRLAITGQLGPDALTSDEMAETLKLCVSCKGCRRECPTGVDMAQDEDRGAGGAGGKIRPVAARPAGGLSAALRALRGEAAVAAQSARCDCRARRNCRRRLRDLARGEACRAGAGMCFDDSQSVIAGRWSEWRSRALRRHLQPLFRARESRCRDRGAERRRLPGACGKAGRWFVAAVVLRQNLSLHRPG